MDRSTRSNRNSIGGIWYGALLFLLLLVLPAAFLGTREWSALNEERDAAIARLPEEVEDSADRLIAAVKERVNLLIEAEEQRPFWHYRLSFHPPSASTDELNLIDSPLIEELPPVGVLGYFSRTKAPNGNDSMQLFCGLNKDAEQRAELSALLERFDSEIFPGKPEERQARGFRFVLLSLRSKLNATFERVPFIQTAINLSSEEDREVLNAQLKTFRGLEDKTLEVETPSLVLKSFLNESGEQRIVATRTVTIYPSTDIEDLPEWLAETEGSVKIEQGFFIDPQWLFFDLPDQIAKTSLQANIFFRRARALTNKQEDFIYTARSLSESLEVDVVETSIDDNADKLVFLSKPPQTERYFKKRRESFLVSTLLLAASLGTGLFLLLRAVREGVNQASRTRNFVAAVGHELRTPVTALRLYSEMLTDGWASDETKRAEYHERILRESQRLELLIDRVMQKSRLETSGAKPIVTQLPGLVDEIVASQIDTREDISLEMNTAPISALADPEGVRSILENLIDNARKYAHCTKNTPVEIYVGVQNGSPFFTVSDRGPGISNQDRGLIFDAFYRSGDEERRSAKGIGLGLHLASLHANAMGATISVSDRHGGGSVFSVLFEAAAS